MADQHVGVAFLAALDAVQKIARVRGRALHALAVRDRLHRGFMRRPVGPLALAVERRARKKRQIRDLFRYHLPPAADQVHSAFRPPQLDFGARRIL